MGALVGSDVVLWCVVAAGILLRLARYADNRSLWLDESFLALNILEKSATELLGTLDFLQAAPAGFLLIERFAVVLFGDSEYALRLFPLAAGIASLFLFRAVARRFLRPTTLLFAVALFAVNGPLIYYSSEVKPYGTDVMVTLGLLLLACRLTERSADDSIRDWAALAAAGLLAVWLSFPAVFILAGISVALLVQALTDRLRRRTVLVVGVGVAWLASFTGAYVVSAQNTTRIADAIFGSGETHQPGILDNVRQAWGGFVDPGGFVHGTNGLAVLMFVVGGFALARRERLHRVALLIVPLAAAFAGAIVDRYPLGGRYSLFLVPVALIVIARGVQEVAAVSRPPALLAVPIAAFLVLSPAAQATSDLLDPPASEHTRPLLGYLDERAEARDVLYVYRNAQYALRYYTECDDCDAWEGGFPWPLRPANEVLGIAEQPALESVPPSVLVGKVAPGDQLVADLRELESLPRDRRIWFLFSHVQRPNGVDEQAFFLAYLDRNGRRLDAVVTDGASAYLYELTRSER